MKYNITVIKVSKYTSVFGILHYQQIYERNSSNFYSDYAINFRISSDFLNITFMNCVYLVIYYILLRWDRIASEKDRKRGGGGLGGILEKLDFC